MTKILKNKSEIIISISLIIIALLLTDPANLIMPTSVQMTLLGFFAVIYILLASLVYKEKPKDEREAQILNQSSRLAFIGGTSFLLIGIIVQSMQHNLDSWLVWALVLIVAIKNLSHYYLSRT